MPETQYFQFKIESLNNFIMKIILVAAMSENRAIGLNGKLPWGNLPDDLAHVYNIIKNKKTVMGKKSYDTPDRIASSAGNVVVSKLQNIVLEPNFEYANSLAAALEKLKLETEIIVLGGAQIFEQVIDRADTIYLTLVQGIFSGDAFFPKIDLNLFELKDTIFHSMDTQHAFSFKFLRYERRITILR